MRSIAVELALAVCILMCGAMHWAEARDLQVQEARAMDGKIKCFSHRDLIVTTSSVPCDGYTAPDKVAVGETFSVSGRTYKIGVIRATQAEQDMLTYGMDIKKGEWTCVAAENLENFPSDAARNRNWLYIRKCQPGTIGATSTVMPLHVITPSFWSQMSEREQNIYVTGVLETLSFDLYAASNPDLKTLVECVAQEGVAKIRKMAGTTMFLEEAANPPPWWITRALGAICKQYRD